MSEPPRNWMTAAEFLAEVEAYRQARLANPVKCTPLGSCPPVRIYVLDHSRLFTPKAKCVQLIIPEDML